MYSMTIPVKVLRQIAFLSGSTGSTERVLSKLLLNIWAVKRGPPKKCGRALRKMVKILHLYQKMHRNIVFVLTSHPFVFSLSISFRAGGSRVTGRGGLPELWLWQGQRQTDKDQRSVALGLWQLLRED